MAETTNIEWADATANFWIGCTKLSPACDHCYAEADWDHRKHRVQWGVHGDRSFVKAGEQVVRKMQRNAAAFIAQHGRKPRIFVNSLSDFADNHRSILPEWRAKVWQLARECPDVILLILTKRPQNLPAYLPTDWGAGYPNVWIGTTAENQTEAERRVPVLLATRAAARFLSCEPLLGPVDLRQWLNDYGCSNCGYGGACHLYCTNCDWRGGPSIAAEGADCPDCGEVLRDDYCCPECGELDIEDFGPTISGLRLGLIDWVIVGGESGPKARPMHPDWARRLRDQCETAGVPFLFKQWGEWSSPGFKPDGFTGDANYWPIENLRGPISYRLGKKLAGRLLDGRTHDGFPHA